MPEPSEATPALTAPVVTDDPRAIPTTFAGKLEANYYCRAWNAKRAKYCRTRAGSGTAHPGAGRCRRHDGGGDDRLVHGLDRRYAGVQAVRIRELIQHHEDAPDPLNILPELAAARAIFQDFVERYDAFTEALLAWHASWQVQVGDAPAAQLEAFRRVVDEFEELLASGDGASDVQTEDLKLARAFLAGSTTTAARPRKILDLATAHQIIGTITQIASRYVEMQGRNAITYDQLKRFLFAAERKIEGRVRDAIPDAAAAERVVRLINKDLRGIRP